MSTTYYMDEVLSKRGVSLGIGHAVAERIVHLRRITKTGSDIELVCIVRRPVLLFWSKYVAFFKVIEP